MNVDVDLILDTMRRTRRSAAIEVMDEYEHESLMRSMEEAGHQNARGPEYSVMVKNPDIVRHGGSLTVTFSEEEGEIYWNGFCWSAYYDRLTETYIRIPADQVFEANDFDFDLDHAALSDLFCSGGVIND